MVKVSKHRAPKPRKLLLLTLLLSASMSAQKPPEGPILLKGAPLGAVKFDHAAHLKVAGRCVVCHHASKSEKPLKSSQEACADCHTTPPSPPINTGLQAAFHNPTGTSGLCITCHKTEDLNGKAAPVKCTECHDKANGS